MLFSLSYLIWSTDRLSQLKIIGNSSPLKVILSRSDRPYEASMKSGLTVQHIYDAYITSNSIDGIHFELQETRKGLIDFKSTELLEGKHTFFGRSTLNGEKLPIREITVGHVDAETIKAPNEPCRQIVRYSYNSRVDYYNTDDNPYEACDKTTINTVYAGEDVRAGERYLTEESPVTIKFAECLYLDQPPLRYCGTDIELDAIGSSQAPKSRTTHSATSSVDLSSLSTLLTLGAITYRMFRRWNPNNPNNPNNQNNQNNQHHRNNQNVRRPNLVALQEQQAQRANNRPSNRGGSDNNNLRTPPTAAATPSTTPPTKASTATTVSRAANRTASSPQTPKLILQESSNGGYHIDFNAQRKMILSGFEFTVDRVEFVENGSSKLLQRKSVKQAIQKAFEHTEITGVKHLSKAVKKSIPELSQFKFELPTASLGQGEKRARLVGNFIENNVTENKILRFEAL